MYIDLCKIFLPPPFLCGVWPIPVCAGLLATHHTTCLPIRMMDVYLLKIVNFTPFILTLSHMFIGKHKKTFYESIREPYESHSLFFVVSSPSRNALASGPSKRILTRKVTLF